MPDHSFETIRLDRRDHVAVVILDRPQAMNAINLKMRSELFAALDQLRHDVSIRAVILTGSGEKAFSAGMDLREFSDILRQTPLSEMRRFRWESGEGLAVFDKPIIAAVNGLAIGGGVELALLCDVCYASDNATFAFAEVKRGLMPGNGGTQRLSRRIGRSLAIEMILSGCTVDAAQAGRIGLVDHVVPPDQLMAQAMSLAAAIAKNAPVAVRTAKAAISRGLDMPLGEALNLERDLATFLYTTDDAKEGPLAFVEKRDPRWQHL